MRFVRGRSRSREPPSPAPLPTSIAVVKSKSSSAGTMKKKRRSRSKKGESAGSSDHPTTPLASSAGTSDEEMEARRMPLLSSGLQVGGEVAAPSSSAPPPPPPGVPPPHSRSRRRGRSCSEPRGAASGNGNGGSGGQRSPPSNYEAPRVMEQLGIIDGGYSGSGGTQQSRQSRQGIGGGTEIELGQWTRNNETEKNGWTIGQTSKTTPTSWKGRGERRWRGQGLASVQGSPESAGSPNSRTTYSHSLGSQTRSRITAGSPTSSQSSQSQAMSPSLAPHSQASPSVASHSRASQTQGSQSRITVGTYPSALGVDDGMQPSVVAFDGCGELRLLGSSTSETTGTDNEGGWPESDSAGQQRQENRSKGGGGGDFFCDFSNASPGRDGWLSNATEWGRNGNSNAGARERERGRSLTNAADTKSFNRNSAAGHQQLTWAPSAAPTSMVSMPSPHSFSRIQSHFSHCTHESAASTEFDDAEWTPQDSSFGAACPFCGFVPKNIRRMIEWGMVFVVVGLLVGVVVTTSMRISNDHSSSKKGGGKNVITDDAVGVDASDIVDDDYYIDLEDEKDDDDDDIFINDDYYNLRRRSIRHVRRALWRHHGLGLG